MGHGLYLFLVDLDDPNADEIDIARDAESTFDSNYSYEHCDENNWNTCLAVVLQDGRFVTNNADDIKHHEGAVEVAASPAEHRWQAALNLAYVQSAHNLGEVGEGEIDLAAMVERARKYIAKNIRKPHSGRCVSLMEAIAAYEDCSFGPFCEDANEPYYEWNCYDLRTDRESDDLTDNTAILLVDIHT